MVEVESRYKLSNVYQTEETAVESVQTAKSEDSELKLDAETLEAKKEVATQPDICIERVIRRTKPLNVSFKDEIKGQLAEVLEVESYKEYNRLEPEKMDSCCCNIV